MHSCLLGYFLIGDTIANIWQVGITIAENFGNATSIISILYYHWLGSLEVESETHLYVQDNVREDLWDQYLCKERKVSKNGQ